MAPAALALAACLAAAQGPPPPRVAILIDDIGYDRAGDLGSLGLGGAYSYAILPHAPHGARFAAAARALGRDALLHLPMEAEHRNSLLGPDALRRGMDERAIVATLADALASVGPVVGVNNHMGSRLTREAGAMRRFARSFDLAARGLFFVDSRTTPRTVAARELRAAGIAVLERDVFIDHVPRPAAIQSQLGRLVTLARRRGAALGIAHPHRATLAALRGFSPGRSGVTLVPVSRLLAADAGRRADVRAGDSGLALGECAQQQHRAEAPQQPHGGGKPLPAFGEFAGDALQHASRDHEPDPGHGE